MDHNEDQPASAAPADILQPDESRTPTEFADEEWLSLEQVALRMNCSATQVREWIASGQLTPEANGSIERVRRSEIERLGSPTESAADAFEKQHADESS
jgi:hypothetical protein